MSDKLGNVPEGSRSFCNNRRDSHEALSGMKSVHVAVAGGCFINARTSEVRATRYREVVLTTFHRNFLLTRQFLSSVTTV